MNFTTEPASLSHDSSRNTAFTLIARFAIRNELNGPRASAHRFRNTSKIKLNNCTSVIPIVT
jgi:hypothetical protein